MPWCPKCRTEYRQGISNCIDCETKLVPELEDIAESINYVDDKEAFLVTASNNVEVEIIVSLLNSNNIPVLKKYREAGDYLKVYMGGTNFGVDLYVPSKLLEKAKDYIRGMQESNFDEVQQAADDEEPYINEEAQQDFDAEVKHSSKKRSISVWIVILIPLIFCILVYILNNLLKWNK